MTPTETLAVILVIYALYGVLVVLFAGLCLYGLLTRWRRWALLGLLGWLLFGLGPAGWGYWQARAAEAEAARAEVSGPLDIEGRVVRVVSPEKNSGCGNPSEVLARSGLPREVQLVTGLGAGGEMPDRVTLLSAGKGDGETEARVIDGTAAAIPDIYITCGWGLIGAVEGGAPTKRLLRTASRTVAAFDAWPPSAHVPLVRRIATHRRIPTPFLWPLGMKLTREHRQGPLDLPQEWDWFCATAPDACPEPAR